MAKRRNTLKLTTSGFDELITKLDELGGDIMGVVEDALIQAGETIGDDTVEAVDEAYLPAEGKYSKGDTKKSIIRKPKVEWKGTTASVGVGFDYSKPGAGGFLITGTPRMKPDYELQKIYKKKQYMKQIKSGMIEIVQNAIAEKMGG